MQVKQLVEGYFKEGKVDRERLNSLIESMMGEMDKEHLKGKIEEMIGKLKEAGCEKCDKAVKDLEDALNALEGAGEKELEEIQRLVSELEELLREV